MHDVMFRRVRLQVAVPVGRQTTTVFGRVHQHVAPWEGQSLLSTIALYCRWWTGMSILLALSVYDLIVTEKLPTTSDAVPLLGIKHG